MFFVLRVVGLFRVCYVVVWELGGSRGLDLVVVGGR